MLVSYLLVLLEKGLFKMVKIFILFLYMIFIIDCRTIEVIPEPTLGQISVESPNVCLKWNWHPFCVESKPNSINIVGIISNSTLEKKYYLDYYIDSFDADIPVGISLRVGPVYYQLKKIHTDYTDILKIRSELPLDFVDLLIKSNDSMMLSYSNRKDTMNIDFSDRHAESFRNSIKEVVSKVNSLEKMNIVKK
jgi:hypothetical protein